MRSTHRPTENYPQDTLYHPCEERGGNRRYYGRMIFILRHKTQKGILNFNQSVNTNFLAEAQDNFSFAE